MSGGKLRGLEELVQYRYLGYTVPKFAEIGTEYFDDVLRQRAQADVARAIAHGILKKQVGYAPAKLPERISQRLRSIEMRFAGRPLIVRSNSLREGGELSFRGRYESRVVDGSLDDAALAVYTSFFSQKAEAYRAEHNVTDDAMNPVVQVHIPQPAYAGVMHTSNPSCPGDLSIEFTVGGDYVTGGTRQPFILDFDKSTGSEVFRSENLGSRWQKDHPHINRIKEMGVALEEWLGPSYVEFRVKRGRIYFIQRDPINDLAQPEQVHIPEQPGELLGETRVTRGHGKLTLPIVKIDDYQSVMDVAEKLFIMGEDSRTHVIAWFDQVRSLDAQFKDGYVLVTPHFHDTVIRLNQQWYGLPYETSTDALTAHKRAIITTRSASTSSHALTVARDRGIVYAGFDDDDELFNKVDSGDVLSMYFLGRSAKVFRERKVLRSIHDSFPGVRFCVKPVGEGVWVETSKDIGTHRPYEIDMHWFLSQQGTWSFTPFGGTMGGYFTDEQGRSLCMSIGRHWGTKHSWRVDAHEGYCEALRITPLPGDELRTITQAYAQHLTKN